MAAIVALCFSQLRIAVAVRLYIHGIVNMFLLTRAGDAYPRPLVVGYAMQKGYIYTGTRHSRLKIPKREIEDKLVFRHVCTPRLCWFGRRSIPAQIDRKSSLTDPNANSSRWFHCEVNMALSGTKTRRLCLVFERRRNLEMVNITCF